MGRRVNFIFTSIWILRQKCKNVLLYKTVCENMIIQINQKLKYDFEGKKTTQLYQVFEFIA